MSARAGFGRALRRSLLGLLVLVAGMIAWLMRPLPPITRHVPIPATSFDDAVERMAELQAADTMALHEGCAMQAWLQGQRTPRAFVLLHGITNCPLQFAALGADLAAGGDNVIVPRVPHHGLADRMTEDLARLSADEAVSTAAACVALARGLGDTVVVIGLSTSGVLAADAVQQGGVDRAVVLAPAFAPPWKPAWLAPILTRLALRLPNQFVWWDDRKREHLDGPTQCYPRFSTRAMGQMYALGERVAAAAARRAPAAHDLAVVLTESDEAVDNARGRALAAAWRAHGATVRTVVFPRASRVQHDMVDPVQVDADSATVYPVLRALARGEAVSPSLLEGATR